MKKMEIKFVILPYMFLDLQTTTFALQFVFANLAVRERFKLLNIDLRFVLFRLEAENENFL
jgi:hypothetical protein